MNRLSAVSGLLALLIVAESALLHAQRAHRVSFRTADDVTIAASLFEATRRPAPAVVLVPMMTRTRRDWEPMAARLAAEGIAALAIDVRGHGESARGPGDAAASITAMEQDVLAAVRFLQSRPDVLPDRIGIAGASLGANLAVLTAAALPSVKSIALLSPSMDYRGLRIEGGAAKYGTRPMLLVASQEDPYAMRTVRELADEKLPQREEIVLEHAGHGTVMFRRDASLIRAFLDWFHRTL